MEREKAIYEDSKTQAQYYLKLKEELKQLELQYESTKQKVSTILSQTEEFSKENKRLEDEFHAIKEMLEEKQKEGKLEKEKLLEKN